MAGSLFGLILLAFVVMLVGVVGDIHPNYGVPRIYFGSPPILSVLLFLPVALALLAVGMAASTVLAWWQRYWGWFGRLHYSALTLLALGVVWVLWYWNLMGI